MATGIVKLGQVFNIYDAFIPTKASAYLRPVGGSEEYFNISLYDSDTDVWGAVIDSPNFATLTNNDPLVSVYKEYGLNGINPSGSGAMYAFDPTSTTPISNDDGPRYNYPIRSGAAHVGTYTLWVRGASIYTNINFGIFLDGEYQGEISSAAVADTNWHWYSFDIDINNAAVRILGIEVRNPSGALDKIYIAPQALASIPAGEGPDFTVSPYITVHPGIQNVKSNGEPDTTYIDFLKDDFRTTLHHILDQDWYNFDIDFVDPVYAVDFGDRQAFTLTSSGSSSDRYIVWDLNEPDSYTCGVASFKTTNTGFSYTPPTQLIPTIGYYYIFNGLANIVSDQWYSREDKNFLLRVYEDRTSVEPYGDYISIPAGHETSMEVNSFTGNTFDMVNTEIVDDEVGGEDIQLELDSKIIGMVIDESGSMSWNDVDDNRYDIAERFIRKLSSTYPGSLEYVMFKFGGQEFDVVFAAGPEENIDNPNLICSADAYGDSNSRFFGVRIVRNTSQFPSSPIDGEIIFNGIANSVMDNDIVSGETYYYKIYTFDNVGHFSDGVNFLVTPYGSSVPQGLSLVESHILKGSGVRHDDNTMALWHFDNKHQIEINSRDVYDFTADTDLRISDTVPQWLNSDDVPAGFSGLRFNGQDTSVSTSNTTSYFVFRLGFTVMAWIKPFSLDDKKPIIARQSNTDNGWMLSTQDNTGRLLFDIGGVTVGTSTMSVVTDEWNHVAVVVEDNGDGIFYINGVQSGTFSVTSSNLQTNMFLDIGYDRISNNYYWGELTEVSIHNISRDFSYINDYAAVSTKYDRDNGDRLVVIKGTVPDSDNYENIRIVKKEFKVPGNEEDGDTIYEESASDGDFYTTYREDFLLGSTYNFRVFTQNSIGNFSNIYDSPNLAVIIPIASDEASEDLPNIFLPTPSVTGVLEGSNTIYLQIDNNVVTDDAVSIKIYFSDSDYPVIDKKIFSGELLTEDVPELSEYVHRDLDSTKTYYYTVIYTDKYGRKSESTYVKAIASDSDSMSIFPLLNVDSISYEIKSDTSMKITWNNILPSRNVETYFDENVALYAKLVDGYGNIITDTNNLDVTLSVSSSYTLNDNAAPDVFNDVDEIPTIDSTNLYSYAIEKFDNGELRGNVFLQQTDEVYNNIESVNLTARLNVVIRNPIDTTEIIFQYSSDPIYIKFINPLEVDTSNLNNKFIKIRCSKSLSVLDKKMSYEERRFDGSYVGSNSSYIARIYAYYKKEPIQTGTISVEIHDVNGDLCGDLSLLTDAGLSKSVNQSTNTYTIKNIEEDVLDSNGNPTGGKIPISYIDVPIKINNVNKKLYLYSKISFQGATIIRKNLIVFESPLKIDVMARVPITDGIDKAEQFASVYLLDPDDPENASSITLVDDAWLSWSLVPNGAGTIKALTYSGASPTQPLPENGVLSLISDGQSNKVFIGPEVNVQFLGVDESGNFIYEKHNLIVSCNYEGYVASNTYELEFIPFASQSDATSGSYVLMEFDAYKKSYWTDGRNYGKLIISHNPATSDTKYASTFINCLTAAGEEIVQLRPGQGMLIHTNDPNIEIIWGDVIEYVDPYVGDWVLDTSNANIGYGSVFIRLSDGDETYVFFRKHSLTQNWSTDFEDPSNNLCKEFLGIVSIPEYKEETIVTASTVSLYSSDYGNIAISLKGGGDLQDSVIPTILIPEEPLIIRAVDKRVNGVTVDNFIIDGTTKNELLLDVFFSGRIVPNGTEVNISVVNNFNDIISVEETVVTTFNEIIEAIDSVEHSYATITFRPIVPGVTFDSEVFLSVTYDLEGGITRTSTICVRLSADAEDYLTDPTADTVRSLFSNKVETSDISVAPNLVWNNGSEMNSERAYFAFESSGTESWAIGGVNGVRILNSVDHYNMTTDTWTAGGVAMTTARMMPASVMIGNLIYVFGGVEFDPSNGGRLFVSRKSEVYNTATQTWASLEDMPNLSLGGPDRVSYGVAGGVAMYDQRDGTPEKIFILSGFREMTKDGLAVDYNDRILEYDISNDIWSYSDVISTDEIEHYERAFCNLYDASDSIYLICGGSKYQNEELTYITDAYFYNSNTGELSQADDRFGALPDFRERTSIAKNTSNFFIMGGSDIEADFSDTCEGYTLLGNVYQKDRCTGLTYARSGCGSAIIQDGVGDNHIIVAGGMVSGKGNNFLEIFTDIFNNNVSLSREEAIDIKIRVRNEKGDAPSGNINATVRGYLQLASVQEGYENIIPKDFVDYQVKFLDDTIVLGDGEGYARLLPRYDDYLNKIMSFVSFGEETKYKIVIQTTINNTTHYGNTFVYFSDLINQTEIPDVECIPSSSNLQVESIQYNNNINGFDLLGGKLQQRPAGIINYYNDRPWIPDIENLTPDGSVSASSAIDILDDLRTEEALGGSPLYDALTEISEFLSSISYWNDKKSIYVFTDSEPNMSYYSLDQASIDVNGIDNYQEVPVVLVDLSIDNDAILPTLYRGIRYPDHNTLASETGGQAFTISDNGVIDDLVLMMSGEAKGSLGYGEAVYILDFEKVVNLRSAAVNYKLYSNTNGRWKIAISLDGFNYEENPEYFEPNYSASFDNASCRYVKFIMEIYSGLSASNNEAYEDIPTAGVPAVTDIDITYADPKEDFIYINPVNADIDQLVVATNSNIRINDDKNIFAGTTTGNYSHHWNDYDRDAQPAVEKNGKIVVPLRRGTAESQRIEPLTNIDGHMFKTTNGPWGPWATVQIYSINNNVITVVSSSKYNLYFRDGLVAFNENRDAEGSHYINIINDTVYRIGIKILNNETDETRIYGIARLHNEPN